MIGLSRLSATAALPCLAMLAASSPATAQITGDYGASNPDIDFCVEGGACDRMTIRSRASVAVLKTNITQQSTDGACENIEKVLKRNLSQSGAQAVVNFDPNCKYKVRFNTTSGCIGDKTAYMKVGQIEDYDGIELKGGCGTLKARKYVKSSSGGVIEF